MHTESNKAVMALSGGMDSAALLFHMLDRGYAVTCVNFYYGSKHNKYERECARLVAEHAKVQLIEMDISNVMDHMVSDLLLSGGEIPEGHYEDANMKRTVVPGRNTIFASIMSGIAWSKGASVIALGVHAGDHAIYPDCRKEYIDALNMTIQRGTDDAVAVIAPFVHATKGDIVRAGLKLGVPFELTRTCYKDQPISCGRCGSCTERLEAFANNGETDPIPYEA